MIRQHMNVFQLNVDVGDGRILGHDGGPIDTAPFPLAVLMPTRTGTSICVGQVFAAWLGDGDRLWMDIELADSVAQAFDDGTVVWGVDTAGGKERSVYPDEFDPRRYLFTGWYLIGLSVLPRKID